MADRKTCTKETPYDKNNPEHNGRWQHPDAIEVDEDYGQRGGVADGDYVKYQCPHCKHLWREELPN